MFQHLVDGDGEWLASKREFYKEYKAVMDRPAEYYLQTISAVFQEHLLPRGLLTSRGRHVDCAAITHTALLTIEGERDDISGIGQTRAAHALCACLDDAKRLHIEQAGLDITGCSTVADFAMRLRRGSRRSCGRRAAAYRNRRLRLKKSHCRQSRHSYN
jgi:poly(3-hydroxybutyrate) depolymerase